jgi:thiamine-phosphate pyrophosphorylase
VITDETLQDRWSHVELGRLAAQGGADVVQFREKRPRSVDALWDLLEALREGLHEHGTRLVVNDRVELAARVGADGVHLGPSDLPPVLARELLGPEAVIGGTANNLEQAHRVALQPVDYVGLGPVFGTRSKRDPAPALGLEGLGAAVRELEVPVIAIGGIGLERLPEVLSTGVYGVAVLSDVVCADDPAARTAALAEVLFGLEARPVAR